MAGQALASGPVGAVVAIDAGTTGVRSLAFGEDGALLDTAYRELTQHFPRPGWVEHDPDEIWNAALGTLREVSERQVEAGRAIAGIGITNQRETVVAWDRRSGSPLHRAIVWQDRRTTSACEELVAAGHLPLVRERTGLVIDPYFSATKMRWLLTEGGVRPGPELALGTVDSWIVWNLTGGPRGGRLVTDPSNASRTMLFDISETSWAPELAELFGVPMEALPEVVPSCGRIAKLSSELAPAGTPLAGVPLSGVAGDQQAALFGQTCFDEGMAKATYGTGTFVLVNVGSEVPRPPEGLLGTVAWDLGATGNSHEVGSGSGVRYALEGSVFATGAAIQWLRDGLGIIGDAAEVGPLASSVQSADGMHIVPAFSGLGSPWWDPRARAAVVGLTKGSDRARFARAVVESIAYQTRDVLDAMRAAGAPPLSVLRVDGGAAVMDLLLQLQADQAGVTVARPRCTETTALGAAMLAGLAEGVWGSLDELSSIWVPDAELAPSASRAAADSRHDQWLRALDRARDWVG